MSKMTDPVTEQELDELDRLCERIPKGPWKWSMCYEIDGEYDLHWALVNDESERQGKIIDALLVLEYTDPEWFCVPVEEQPIMKFVASSSAVIPRLVAEVRRLQAAVAKRSTQVTVAYGAEYAAKAEIERLKSENERLWAALSATTDPICICGKPFSLHILHDDGCRRCYIIDRDGKLTHTCDGFKRLEWEGGEK